MMFNSIELSKTLDSSTWSENSKAKIKIALPHLGQYSLSFLDLMINRTGSVFDAGHVAELLTDISELHEDSLVGQTSEIAEYVKALASSSSEIDNEAVLAFILDLRSNKVSAANIDPNLSLIFTFIEADLSKDLPLSEYSNLLSIRLAEFIKCTDIHLETKRYFYYRVYDDQEDVSKLFQTNILKSSLKIGVQSAGGNEDVETDSSIASWIKDFHDKVGSGNTGSFDFTNYLVKQTAFKTLTPQDQEMLKDILKVYLWLYDPIVTALEIAEYESYRQTVYIQKDFDKDEAVNEAVELQPEPAPQLQKPRQPVPIIPSQPDAPPLYKIGTKGDLNLKTQPKKGLIYDTPTNIDIDKEAREIQHRQVELLKVKVKLEDLKKRKSKTQ